METKLWRSLYVTPFFGKTPWYKRVVLTLGSDGIETKETNTRLCNTLYMWCFPTRLKGWRSSVMKANATQNSIHLPPPQFRRKTLHCYRLHCTLKYYCCCSVALPVWLCRTNTRSRPGYIRSKLGVTQRGFVYFGNTSSKIMCWFYDFPYEMPPKSSKWIFQTN